MQNKIIKFIFYIFFGIIFFNYSNANDQFTFNITEIDIKNNGNLIIGSKNGKAESNNGDEIIAETFEYNKLTNILKAYGSVKIINKYNNLIINSDKVTYLKNDEIIYTEGNSEAINNNYNLVGSKFKFDKSKNILIAEENVKFTDTEKDTVINSDKVTYLKNDEIIYTDGKTSGSIDNKFKFESKNVTYLKKENELSSQLKSSITDNNENIYNLDKFLYNLDSKLLKGINVSVISKIADDKQDNYYFSDGFFDLNSENFISKDTKIKVHKGVFDNENQDPRIYGTSSFGNKSKTVINNGVFTSCNQNGKCPPWSITSEKITHDKIKKNLIYDNAVLKIYDIPVVYFPKFFHPDPSVKRRTGFLQPQFNNSKTLGSSVFIPYFKTLGDNKDYTFKPTIFDDMNKYILQNEFRRITKDSFLITDFSLTRGYQSSPKSKKKNINHIFLDYKKSLNLEKFISSDLELKVEKVNNDTYLKVFQNNLFTTPVMPKNKDLMQTSLKYDLDHEKYNLTTGFQIYESLGKSHSDRYQYVLPSYDFSRELNLDINGSINIYSSGSNNLKDTNNLSTIVTNDVEYKSIDYFTNKGFKNNFNLYFKNLNAVGKNNENYNSSPSVDGMSIFEISSSYPLFKVDNLATDFFTPKISFRVNPTNKMKNYSTSKTTLTADDIFSINRLGLSDSLEAGKSITLGLDYKRDFDDPESDKDKFLEFKLATVIRDEVEENIPISSTIDKKNSNLFGSINHNLFENINFGYDFSIDNDLKTFESHSVNTSISINNFLTEFDFTEKGNELGSDHVLSNKTTYNLNENNYFQFTTRRNKEISLTEYYNLSYQYKNDCLVAGIKYNKTFYQDNDLKPSENLFFTITLTPLTTYERIIYEN